MTDEQGCSGAVERRSGKYVGAGTALRQISLATGGTLTLKRVPANHVVLDRLTLDQFILWPKLSQTRDLASKISTPPAPTPSTATRRARGRKLPRCWDLGLGNRPNQNLPLHPCWWACLSVLLSVSPLAYLKNHNPYTLPNVFVHVASGRGAVLAALQYVMYSRFCRWRHVCS